VEFFGELLEEKIRNFASRIWRNRFLDVAILTTIQELAPIITASAFS
jgi:hypothetical protein